MDKRTVYHPNGLSQVYGYGSHIFTNVPSVVLMELMQDEDAEQKHQGKPVHIISNRHIGCKTRGKPYEK